MTQVRNVIAAKTASRAMEDLNAICRFGGRLSGTASEAAAIAWLRGAASEALGASCLEHVVNYEGWVARSAELRLPDGERLACHPLVRSRGTPENGVTAEVVDLGRGLAADFAQYRDALKGRIALFHHEVMFSRETFHRREKLRLAREAGAVGALVSSIVEDELVTGSSRAEGEPGIAALGITPEAAARLRPTDGRLATARMLIRVEEAPAQSKNLIFDLPGTSGKWIVLSAHIDGHNLAESALDNASGVAASLEVARRMRAAGPHRHGLRIAFFSVEEWGLTGSDQYLASLSPGDLEAILLNINLDTVVGGSRLTALTSGFADLSAFIDKIARAAGFELGIHEPLQRNSDHANFALRGIPAFRLLSGFDEPESSVRFVLTGQDRRNLVQAGDMEHAVEVSAALTQAALQLDETIIHAWRG